MSIYDEVALTQAEKDVMKIRETSARVLEGEKNRCKAAFENMWFNPETEGNMTRVQNLLNEIGYADLLNAFQSHSAWQTFIATADPSYVPLVPPYNVTVGEDGSITLSEIPEGESFTLTVPE